MSKLNLIDKLNKTKKGTRLYHLVYGDVSLVSVYAGKILLELDNGSQTMCYDDGRMHSDYYGECVLFPSKGNRNWNTFIPNVLDAGTPVMFSEGVNWCFGYYISGNNVSALKYDKASVGAKRKYIVPFNRFDMNDFDSNFSKSVI